MNTVWADEAVWSEEEPRALNFESKFALWMARTHVTDIWGGFSLDATKPIYEEKIFSRWKDLSENEIVQELVDLGLQGGIRRALDDPEEALSNAIQGLYEQLKAAGDNPEKVKQILSPVRDSLSFDPPRDSSPLKSPPKWVNTRAFAICFYHGMRQAAYHALKMYLQTYRTRKSEWYLRIAWNDQSVSIYNRGKVEPNKHFKKDFLPKDREFFNLFVEKANVFFNQKEIAEQFEIEGPKPSDIPDSYDIWQLVITKEKL